MAKINKATTSKYSESVNLDIELNGQRIIVSVQAIDGQLRVLAGPQNTNIASLTFPVNMTISNFEYPSD